MSSAMCHPFIGFLLIVPCHHSNVSNCMDHIKKRLVDVNCHMADYGSYLQKIIVSQKFQWAITFAYSVRSRCHSHHWIQNNELFDLK